MRWSASKLNPNCGYANVLSATRPRSAANKQACNLGTAFHRLAEGWIKGQELPVLMTDEMHLWITTLRSRWVPPPSVRTEVLWGLTDGGNYVHVEETAPHVYASPTGVPVLTAGRADVCWVDQATDTLICLDWKTGRYPSPPAEFNLQVNAAGLALARRFFCSAYIPGIYYVRGGDWDMGEAVPLGSPTAAERFAAVKHAAELDETPRPGEWCGGCWERKLCPQAQP